MGIPKRHIDSSIICEIFEHFWPLHGLRQKTRQRQIWVANCRIPDDRIDEKRYPLFIARAVLKELIESL